MKINKRKDGKISILLSKDETNNLLNLSIWAHAAGYFEGDEMIDIDYDEKKSNRELFNKLSDI